MHFSKELEALEKRKQRLVAEETIALRKALHSENPNDLIKAQTILNERYNKDNQIKSFFVDPVSNLNAYGYLNTPQRVNDHTLRRMAKHSPIIKSIIETRVEQVADFLEPQQDKYSPGFIIRKKKKHFGEEDKELTTEEKRKIELITEFLLRGCMSSELDNICDDLNTWGRKVTKDTLVLDKMSSEIIWNNANTLPVGYVAVDGATIFFADIYTSDGKYKEQDPDERPRYVQVIQNEIRNEYFDRELMFGIRNASTDLMRNGYGESELEVLINTVTAMLQGDAYNSNIFKIGSTPAGIFRVQGNMNESRLRAFRDEWKSSLSGYENSHKMAFLEADKMEFIDMSKSNRDMEYSKFQEYLIKLSCAVYKISPEEIGFNAEGGGKGSMFQDSGDKRIEYSKKKGLKPLLKFIQRNINDSIISKIDNQFQFVFVGMKEDSEERELEMIMKKASSLQGFKEARKELGLSEDLEEGDAILNPVYMQYLQMEQQAKMMGNAESNEFMNSIETDIEKGSHANNPMAKELQTFVETELIEK